jgi:ribonuclease-3 family protein
VKQPLANPQLLTGSNLAYLGDAYYELYIRLHLLKQGITKPLQLQRRAKNYVSASAQAIIFSALEQLLTEEELGVFRRGRNGAHLNHRRNVDPGEYSISSGLEAIIGFLYLKNDFDRLSFLIDQAIKTIDNHKE